MAIAAMLIPLLIQYGPTAVSSIVALWRKEAPNDVALQEWEALLKTLSTSYDQYIANAQPKPAAIV